MSRARRRHPALARQIETLSKPLAAPPLGSWITCPKCEEIEGDIVLCKDHRNTRST